MPTHVVVLTTVTDPSWVANYVAGVGPVVEQYNGRVVTRAPVTKVLEGDHRPHAAVILEFRSKHDALRCYGSDEYAPLKALRHSGSTSEMFVIGE